MDVMILAAPLLRQEEIFTALNAFPWNPLLSGTWSSFLKDPSLYGCFFLHNPH